ncbi:hypothetical protein DFH08DRAFT_969227 [Mycena albidolilacea]|uniref:Uncharacterized protein n=1 Tax=Mycena albidolilacea TaxID=1033008 RepID=A0AAD6ZJC4_9AGAR|nr:hypothetical protein DFH08DRAFT_969227 [Mycena albidolilacea]
MAAASAHSPNAVRPARTPPDTRRAATRRCSDLAAAAAEAAPPANCDLKQYLRLAKAHRKAGGNDGTSSPEAVGLDMEREFIDGLNGEQRANLTANGQDLLQNLRKLKTALVERYERYTGSEAVNAQAVAAFKALAQAQAGVSLFSSSIVLALHLFDNPTATCFPPSHILPLLQSAALRPHPHLPLVRSAQRQQQPSARKVSQALHSAVQKATADELERWRAQREEAAAKDAAVASTGPAPAAEYGQRSSEYGSGASAAAGAYAAGSGSAYGGSQVSLYGGAKSTRPRPRFRACDTRCVDVRRTAADGTRPRVFRAFQFWGRRVHVPKQREVSFPQPAHETSTNVNTNLAPAPSYAPSYSSHSNTSSPASYAGPSANSNYGGSSAPLSNYSASLTSYLSPSSAHAYTSAAFSSPSNAYNTTSTPYASTPYSTSSSASVHSTPVYLRLPYAYGSLYEWDS